MTSNLKPNSEQSLAPSPSTVHPKSIFYSCLVKALEKDKHYTQLLQQFRIVPIRIIEREYPILKRGCLAARIRRKLLEGAKVGGVLCANIDQVEAYVMPHPPKYLVEEENRDLGL